LLYTRAKLISLAQLKSVHNQLAWERVSTVDQEEERKKNVVAVGDTIRGGDLS